MEKIIHWKVIWNFSRKRKISKYVISKLLKFKEKNTILSERFYFKFLVFQDIYIYSTVWNINDFKWISLHNISFDSIEFSSKISQNTVTYVTDMEKVWCAFSPKDRATYNARAYFVGYVISFIVMSNLFFFTI